MKIAFVVPEDDGQYGLREEFTRCRIFPPASLARMAGQIGGDGKIIVIDERIKCSEHDDLPDITMIFVNSYNQGRAWELAGQYRKQGSYVILTGPVLYDTPETACRHADSLFIGAGEDSFPIFLKDYHQGKARRLYMSMNRAVTGNPTLAIEGNAALSLV